MNKFSLGLLAGAWLCVHAMQAQSVFNGRVVNSEKEPLPAAIVLQSESNRATTVSSDGRFSFVWPAVGDSLAIEIRMIGYQTLREKLARPTDTATRDFTLLPAIYDQQEVVITASRMSAKFPGTFTNLDKAELQKLNLGQDLPIQLRFTPSLVATSDAGAGVGYTGLRIRGSDQTRINVTVNGIPINDSESQGVFWVNMPDLSSSLSSAQIQRGLGTSTNGSGAFGASINLLTDGLADKPGGSVAASYGSFDTRKLTAQLHTGKLKNGFAAEARLSDIRSEGYVDRASSDLNSYYLAGGFYGSKTSVKAIAFGGTERTYQSWFGVPESRVNNDLPGMLAYADRNGISGTDLTNLLESGRQYNFYTYDNQVDDYAQNHHQLHLSHQFTDRLSLKLAGHYTHGEGYFEEYRSGDSLTHYGLMPPANGPESTDLIRRRWLDNDFYGAIYDLRYTINEQQFSLGGGVHRYQGDHFGEIVWAEFSEGIAHLQRYYQGDGNKDEYSVFAKWEGTIGNWILMADMQFRGVNYEASGIDNTLIPINVDEQYAFFNPKAGARYRINDRNSIYAYAGMGNREPVRSDFVDAIEGNIPKPEQMLDVEIGHTFQKEGFQWNANAFLMRYRDQLVLTGALNDVGASLRANVPNSYRAGVELDASYRISKQLAVSAQLGLSRNQIGRFDQLTYEYTDTDINIVQETFTDTPISFSPSAVASGRLSYAPLMGLELELLSKYVSRQYLDNTGSESRSINPYWINDFRCAYTFSGKALKGLSLQLLVNNIFDVAYSSNGYTYSYIAGASVTENFFYPQAGSNFLLGARFDF